MFRRIPALILSLCLGAAAAPAVLAQAAAPITEQEAHAIGVDAYVYFYSLVTMDISRKQFTNIEPGKEFGKGPMNMFVSVPEYPPASFKGVVRSNFDTLYSIAWLDLTKEPMIVSAPDTGGRYYLLPMLDMWSDVFASPGWRTTGTTAATYIVTPPGWRPDLRDKFIDEFKLPKDTQRIEAPTPYVWIIGRTKTDGPDEDALEHEIEVWSKARQEVEASIPDKERALSWANFNVDDAVRDAVKSSNVVSMLLDGLPTLHEELDRRLSALAFLRRKNAIPEQELPAANSVLGRSFLGDCHPVCEQWNDAFKRLKCDADARLPEV